jgi:hypothetical protein
MLMKDLVELLKLMKEVYDERTGERFAEIMNVIAENHNATAVRALRDASRRTGEARRQKLQLALGHLEGAFTAHSWITDNKPRTLRYRKRHAQLSLQKIDEACQLALMIAAVYDAFGNDEESVRDWIQRGLELVDCWNKLHMSMRWYDPGGETASGIGPYIDLGTIIAEANLSAERRSRRPAEEVERELREHHAAVVDSVIEVIQADTQPDDVWRRRT